MSLSSPYVQLGLAGIFAVAMLSIPILGIGRIWVLGTIGALVLAPYSLISSAPTGMTHVGLAPVAPALMTFTVPILALMIVSRSSFPTGPTVIFFGLSVYLFIAVTLFWGGTAIHWSGALHLVEVMAAFVAGFRMARSGWCEGRKYHWLLWTLMFVLLIELGFSLAQLAGIPLSVHSEIDYYLNEGRMIGTFNHPSTLGKFCLIFMVLFLPGTVDVVRKIRRLSWFAIILCIALSGMTLARANTLAIIFAVIAWIVLDRPLKDRKSRRIPALFGIFVISIPAVTAALERFSIDSGGERSHLAAVGWPFLRSYWEAGMGTNSYVEIVGRTESVTAAGYPWHNSFLLMISEIGIIGAAIVFAPLFWVAWRSLNSWRRRERIGLWSKAYLVTLPGIVLVSTTGWGMVASSTMVMWYLVIGLCGGALTMNSRGRSEVSDLDGLRQGDRAPRQMNENHAKTSSVSALINGLVEV